MNLDQSNKFSSTTIALHWFISIFIIGLLMTGIYMVETKTYSLYSLHKAFGFLIFFVAVVRVAWRIKNGWPAYVSKHKKIEQVMSKIVDWVLISATILLPISGFMQSSISGNGVDVFGFEMVSRNLDPVNVKKVLSYNKELQSFFNFIHYSLGYVVIASLFLHILGTFKHHFLDKDNTLKRMLGLSK